MLRSLMILSLSLCLSAICPADELEDDAISKAKHLTEAAVHLRAAGSEELADQVFKDAEKLLELVNQRLKEKQAVAARLQEEIAELERKLERPKEIEIRVRMLSVPAKHWDELKPAGAKEDSSKPLIVDDAWLKKLADLEQQDAVNKHAETTLSTRDGEAASLKNGGEFPIPVPGPKGVAIQWREFGIHITVLPVTLGFNRVRLQLVMEHSERDPAHAVTINGTEVPGLNTQKVQTVCESRLGETTLVYQFHTKDEVFIGLATPERSEEALAPPVERVFEGIKLRPRR